MRIENLAQIIKSQCGSSVCCFVSFECIIIYPTHLQSVFLDLCVVKL